MIVFSRPPGWKRRAGDVWTSSSGARALRWPRKATLRAALRVLRTSSPGPCDGPASRRTTLLAEKPAKPSDVPSSYESKYSGGKPLPTLLAAFGKYSPSRGSRHACAETVPPLAHEDARLVGAFHRRLP